MGKLDQNFTGAQETAAEDRRKFLQSCGKFALTVPPAMTMLLSTSLVSPAIAQSVGGDHGCYEGDGHDHGGNGPGYGGGNGGGYGGGNGGGYGGGNGGGGNGGPGYGGGNGGGGNGGGGNGRGGSGGRGGN